MSSDWRDETDPAVAVEVDGDFNGVGLAASNVSSWAKVAAQASAAEIRALMAHTDTVAEIQNTQRAGVRVTLAAAEAAPID